MADTFSVVTLNTNGLLDQSKRSRLFSYLKFNNFDFIFLQETHLYNYRIMQQWHNEWGYPSYWSFGTNHIAGSGILVGKNVKIDNVSFDHDYDGRLVIINFILNNVGYRFINVYCPNNEANRKLFLNSLKRHLATNRHIILGGDFNFVENMNLDKFGGNLNRGNAGSKEMSIIKKDFGLVDIFRKLNPNSKIFSWIKFDNTISCRLDRFYVSNSLVPFVISSSISNVMFSDHRPVIINLKFSPEVSLGPSFWKCNVSILKNNMLRDEIAQYFSDAVNLPVSPEWWDKCKQDCKSIIVNNSKRIAYQSKSRIRNIERQMSEYSKLQSDYPGMFQSELIFLQNELNCLLDLRAEGAKVRARVNLELHSDKPSGYFIRKEVDNARKKTITKLINSDNIELNSQSDILLECKTFYNKLLSAEPIDTSLITYFLEDLPKLTEDSQQLCEGPITKEEIIFALKHMRSNKSPGLDGLPKEFYLEFIHLFIDQLVQVYNICFRNNSLTFSQSHGVITLICKDNSKAENLKYWRPISLLNVDYKLLSKALTNRLSRVMSDIINVDQTCSVKGRSITDNVHLLRNIVDYSNDKNVHCALVSIDQSKAFDRVSHEFLFEVLSKFGFGKSFISWIKLLYSNIFSRVLVNGFLSSPFSVTRSVRQGCGLSPLLYVLCIEPFAHRVRLDKSISGLMSPIMESECKISQYADDSTLIVTSISSISRVFLISELYCLASGAQINREKSRGLWLGAWRGSTESPAGLQWSSSHGKFYGVLLGNDDYVSENHNVVFDKFCNTIDMLKIKRLDIVSKSSFINVLACAKLWYVMPVLPLPSCVDPFRYYHKYMFQFIWGNSPECIKRSVMYNDFESGGIKLVNIEYKIKAFLVSHILKYVFNPVYSKWKCFATYWLNINLRYFYPKLTRNDVRQSFEMSPYYSSAFNCFKDFVKIYGKPPEQLLTVKEIYWHFINFNKCEALITKIKPQINFKSVFQSFRSKLLPASVRTLGWKIAHDILPVNSVLYKYHIINDPSCVFCPQAESCEHIFVRCPVGEPTRVLINKLFSLICGIHIVVKFTPNLVLYNRSELALTKRQRDILITLINIAKHAIWYSRNNKKFDYININFDAVGQLFLSKLKTTILAQRQTIAERLFAKVWLEEPSFVSTNNDGLLQFEFPSV
jgi:exonuclease III